MGSFQQVTSLAAPIDLCGRTALVVGATAGIGAAVARQLAEAGARIILAGRDADKLALMREKIVSIASGGVEAVLIELADLGSVKCAASALCAVHSRIDIVIANASVMFTSGARRLTRDGYEMTFGVNHLGNAALLLGLERPIRAAGGRVVIVASEAHRRARRLPIGDAADDRRYSGLRAYGESKLANILFARQLARRWPEVVIHAAHPGGVLTDMMRGAAAGNLFFRLIVRLMRDRLLTPDEAAKGIMRVALDPALAGSSGDYFELGRPDRPSRLAVDDVLGDALYDWTIAQLPD